MPVGAIKPASVPSLANLRSLRFGRNVTFRQVPFVPLSRRFSTVRASLRCVAQRSSEGTNSLCLTDAQNSPTVLGTNCHARDITMTIWGMIWLGLLCIWTPGLLLAAYLLRPVRRRD